MKTEYHIASSILNYVTAARAVTNSDLDIDQIRDEIDSLRIRTIAELDQQGLLRRPYQSYTQFHTFSTKRDTERKIIVAEIPPVYLGRDNKPFIAYVGGTLGESPYRIVIGNQLGWVDNTDNYYRNIKTAHYGLTSEGKGLLTFRQDAPEKVSVRAVFMKPIDLAPYGYLWEKHYYPVPGDVADTMIGKTVNSYLGTMYRIPVQPNTQSDVISTAPKR